MPIETNHEKGVQAENRAALWLEANGYEILERRYKTPMGEIDLIIKRDDVIAFVEVKSRKTEGEALESITPKARKRIIQTAEHFLSTYTGVYDIARFDALAVTLDDIHHLENAWQIE